MNNLKVLKEIEINGAIVKHVITDNGFEIYVNDKPVNINKVKYAFNL